MVTVCETWYLKEEHSAQALELMQQMDDLVGPQAHEDPAWAGHASFYQSQADPAVVLMMYAWRSEEEHRALAESERELLAGFVAEYCARPRDIAYYTELEVEVEHDDDHHHAVPSQHAHG